MATHNKGVNFSACGVVSAWNNGATCGRDDKRSY